METGHFLELDETPTPTRFIKNCEEIGLFHDLQHNPFDETFRIAVDSSSSDISSLKEPSLKSSSEETLNTPQIMLATKTDSHESMYTTLEYDEFTLTPLFIESDVLDNPSSSVKKEVPENSTDVEIIENKLTNNYDHVHLGEREDESENMQQSKSVFECTSISTWSSNLNQNTVTYIRNNPSTNSNIKSFVLESDSSASSSLNIFTNNGNKSFNIKKAVIVNNNNKGITEAKPINSIIKSSKEKTNTPKNNANDMYQFGIQVPVILSGKNVVILPSKKSVNKSEGTQSNYIPQRRVVKMGQVPSVDVKQRLRNLLRSNASQMILDADEKEGYFHNSGENVGESERPLLEDKKEYSRERNRVAQKRCRLKKKKWIMQLKKETECVLSENQDLQVEVNSLRAEIAHLKTLLLAHRNCSVTRTMYKGLCDSSTV